MWLPPLRPQARCFSVSFLLTPISSAIVSPMTTAPIRAHLRASRFLTGLTDTAIHQLAKIVTKVSYAGNQLIFEEGGPREVAVIIHSGAVAIEKSVNGRPVRLATL